MDDALHLMMRCGGMMSFAAASATRAGSCAASPQISRFNQHRHRQRLRKCARERRSNDHH
jgi:hypothetical protein